MPTPAPATGKTPSPSLSSTRSASLSSSGRGIGLRGGGDHRVGDAARGRRGRGTGVGVVVGRGHEGASRASGGSTTPTWHRTQRSRYFLAVAFGSTGRGLRCGLRRGEVLERRAVGAVRPAARPGRASPCRARAGSVKSEPSVRSTVAFLRASIWSSAPGTCAASVYAAATPLVPKLMRATPAYWTGALVVLPTLNPRSSTSSAVRACEPGGRGAVVDVDLDLAVLHRQRVLGRAGHRVERRRGGRLGRELLLEERQVDAVGVDRGGTQADDGEGGEQDAEDRRPAARACAVGAGPRRGPDPCSLDHQDTRVQDRALLQGGPDGAVQAVLEVHHALVLHDVGEQVAVERGVVGEERARSSVRFVVTSSSSRTWRGGTSAHCLADSSPWSG